MFKALGIVVVGMLLAACQPYHGSFECDRCVGSAPASQEVQAWRGEHEHWRAASEDERSQPVERLTLLEQLWDDGMVTPRGRAVRSSDSCAWSIARLREHMPADMRERFAQRVRSLELMVTEGGACEYEQRVWIETAAAIDDAESLTRGCRTLRACDHRDWHEMREWIPENHRAIEIIARSEPVIAKELSSLPLDVVLKRSAAVVAVMPVIAVMLPIVSVLEATSR